MAGVIEPLEAADEDDEDPDTRTDGGTTQSGALSFASKEAAKHTIPDSVFDRLPTKRLAFAAGAASGSVATLAAVLLLFFL